MFFGRTTPKKGQEPEEEHFTEHKEEENLDGLDGCGTTWETEKAKDGVGETAQEEEE